MCIYCILLWQFVCYTVCLYIILQLSMSCITVKFICPAPNWMSSKISNTELLLSNCPLVLPDLNFLFGYETSLISNFRERREDLKFSGEILKSYLRNLYSFTYSFKCVSWKPQNLYLYSKINLGELLILLHTFIPTMSTFLVKFLYLTDLVLLILPFWMPCFYFVKIPSFKSYILKAFKTNCHSVTYHKKCILIQI